MNSPQCTHDHHTDASAIEANGDDRLPLSMFSQPKSESEYEALRRRFGPVVPVQLAPGVPASLVIDHQMAVRILHDKRFSPDPSTWQENAPACPVLPTRGWRPHSAEYERYRAATRAAVAGINLNTLRTTVKHRAAELIDSVTCALADQSPVDLIKLYIEPLVLTALHHMLGYTPDPDDLQEFVDLKRAEPGDDVASRLVHHSSALSDPEFFAELKRFYTMGFQALRDLIANTLLLILTEPRYRGMDGVPPSTRVAVNEVLAKNSPLWIIGGTFPVQPVPIVQPTPFGDEPVGPTPSGDQMLPPHQPVLIHVPACNSKHNNDHLSDGWQLPWGAGERDCPQRARAAADQVANDAVDELYDALPELHLAVPEDELEWRPDLFHHGLEAMPVTLDPPQR